MRRRQYKLGHTKQNPSDGGLWDVSPPGVGSFLYHAFLYVGVVECTPASLSPASSSLTHTRRMDGFCNQNADLLGSLAGLSFPVVYVGVVECAPASPYTYSSSTHRFPDERTPIEATPLSATSVELGLGLDLGLGLGSHSSSHTPLLLTTLLSHNIPLPDVH